MALMKLIFFAALLVFLFDSPIKAENARPILVSDAVISVPVPNGYDDLSEERELPPYAALFVTEEIEPWEKANEFSDKILVYGIGFRPSSEAIKQQKFEEIFSLVRQKIDAQIKGSAFEIPEGLISKSLVDSIYRDSLGNGADLMKITDNRADRKALLLNTKMVIPGVFTFPVLEEISFTRVSGQIVIAHAIRMDISRLRCDKCKQANTKAALLKTGSEIRDGLIEMGQSDE